MKLIDVKLPDKLFGVETYRVVSAWPILLTVMVMLVTYNLVVAPKIDELKQANVKIAGLNQKKAQFDQKRNYLLSIDQEELNKNSGFVTSALLPQKNSYLLLGVVRKIMDSYGFQIESFRISPGDVVDESNQSKVTGVSRIPITLEIVGPDNKYKELVTGLERSLPLLSLDNFELKNESGLSKIKLTISAFYISDQTKVDPNKLTLADLTLTKDESELILKLSQYKVLENADELKVNTDQQFVKYDRSDPFSL